MSTPGAGSAKRALLTGANGFVGPYLVGELVGAGWDVWALSRSGEAVPGARTIRADLLDAGRVADALRDVSPGVVVHLAARSSVSESYADPGGTLENNILGASNLFHAACELGEKPRVLSVGSGEEYGSVAPQDLPVSERQPLAPESPYGVSKAAQGLLALSLHRSKGLPAVVIRPFNHTGPGQETRFVVPSFARQIAMVEAGLMEPVLRVGNLESARDFTDVRDIARAYRLAIEGAEPGHAYNLGSGRAVKISRILEMLLDASGAEVRIEVDPERAKRPDVPEVRADATAFARATGWRPRVPLERTLLDVLQYWRQRVAQETHKRSEEE